MVIVPEKTWLSVLFFQVVMITTLGQNHSKGVVVDADSKEPIEFVDVYNTKDHTTTNAEGGYFFFSTSDSITYRKIGYATKKSAITTLGDTIYLAPKPFALQEVTLVSGNSLWDKLREHLAENYELQPHLEEFFLRATLKSNDKMVRLQDFQGILKRKTMLYTQGMELEKDDYQIALNHMRKIGVKRDTNNINFEFPSFYGILASFAKLNATGDGFDLNQNTYDDETRVRLAFQIKDSSKINAWGHYIINAENFAIERAVINTSVKNALVKENKHIRFGTSDYRLNVNFTLDSVKNKYFLHSAKSNEKVVIRAKDGSFQTVYDLEMIYLVQKPFLNQRFKRNTNTQKDLFKIKRKYDASFWDNQNQLQLTSEMLAFIEQMQDPNSPYKIKSNLK